MRWRTALIVILLIAPTTTQATDWAQWLGPNRDGTTDEKITPWKNQPQKVWTKKVGEGHSSPIIAKGRAFLHTKVPGKDAEQITAYDAKTGKQLWSKSYPRGPFTSIFGVGPRSTPLVDKDLLYTVGVTGIVTCWKAKDGEQVWQVDTKKDFTPPALTFGVSCSPIMVDGKLLLNVGAKGASIVAFERETGKVVWKSQDDKPSYSSPMVIQQGGTAQVIFLTGEGVISLNPKSGQLYWRVPLKDLLNESSTTPVKLGDKLLASSVTFGSMGIDLKSKDGKPIGEKSWRARALNCYFSTPIVVGEDHLYLVTGKLFPPPAAVLRCVQMSTGKELWSKKKPVGKYHAALLKTGNNHLLMLEDTGDLVLLKPNIKEYEELSRSKICGGTWAHPVLANGLVYVRDDTSLICLQLEK